MSDSGTEKLKETSLNEDLRPVIQKRIEELTLEIQILVQKKSAYQKAMKEVDIRLTQLMGALDELTKLVSKPSITVQDQEESDKFPSE